LAVLAEVLDDADLALLDDVDHLPQHHHHRDEHEHADREPHPAAHTDCQHHDCSCSPSRAEWNSSGSKRLSTGMNPSAGHTTSVVPSTPVTVTLVPAGS